MWTGQADDGNEVRCEDCDGDDIGFDAGDTAGEVSEGAAIDGEETGAGESSGEGIWGPG